MIAHQTREVRTPAIHERPALRTYETNSPRAKARLVALAMLADGRLDDAELENLGREDAFQALGVTREGFLEVLYDFCADVERLPRGRGNYLLAPAALEKMLGEVDGIGERKALLRLIFDVIRSDGRLAQGESELFWRAVDTWNFRAAETRAALNRKHGMTRNASA